MHNYTYTHCLQGFDLLVKAAVDVIWVEQRVSWDLGQQVPGKVADVAFTEVPLPKDLSWYYGLCVFMTALAKVPAQILTVPQPLYIVYYKEKVQYSNKPTCSSKASCFYCAYVFCTWIDANAAASTAIVLFRYHHFPPNRINEEIYKL